MLIPGCHSQVFVSEDLRNRVDVGSAHPHPTRGGMPQIVESEIFNSAGAASAGEYLRDVIRHHLAPVKD